jgi:NADH dehydrogenase
MAPLPHVVILGAGFGGIGALQALRHAPVRVTLIDQRDYHTFQPLLYQVATDELDANQVGFPIRELLHIVQNADFHQAAVQRIDLPKKQVVVEGLAPLNYDYLVLALGAVVNFFGTPGAVEHAFPLYTMDDAVRLKTHVLRLCEAVDKNQALAAEGALTFCIVGGGPTGVELAGALAELLSSELAADFPNLPVHDAKILLYEHTPHLLGPFLPKLQAYAQRELEHRGVTVRTGVGVTRIGPDSIQTAAGETVKTSTLVWAAGLQANPMAQSLGVPLAHGGRVPVGPDLQVAGFPGVFAIGDIAAMTDAKTGQVLPGLGAVAQQAGEHAGKSIARLVAGDSPQPFEYVDKGTMAQVGRGAAVVQLPRGVTMTGMAAWLAWLGVHLALLNSFAQRTSVFLDWAWNIVTRRRGKRIILDE